MIDLTGGLVSVSSTGPIGSGSDISSVISDFTLWLTVAAVPAGAQIQVNFENSVNSFGTVETIWCPLTTGLLQAGIAAWDETVSLRAYQLRGSFALFGETGALARVNVTYISAGPASVHAWITVP